MANPVQTSWHHYGSVYRFVRRRSSSPQDAEDVTQDVFEAAASALASSRLDEEPSLAWLYTVARRRLIDRLRVSTPELARLDAEPHVADHSGHQYSPAIITALVESLRNLNEQSRRVVLLKVFEGRSFKEIAAELALSEEACRMRFSRALRELRRELETKGVTP